ncbi:MAG: hypothetical protein R3E96_01040 [Planctomycetota bacterium]
MAALIINIDATVSVAGLEKPERASLLSRMPSRGRDDQRDRRDLDAHQLRDEQEDRCE